METPAGLKVAREKMIQLLTRDHLDDQLAAFTWLKTQSAVDLKRIAVAGNSFGGIETVLGAEHAPYCAAIDASGGAMSWESLELRELMTQSVRKSQAPIFFFQAENDFDLGPSRVLSAAMKDAGKVAQVKFYPPFGKSPEDGHSFAYLGSSAWSADVFEFLEHHCKK
jgi:carboxymethylenebutenolidase